MTIKWSEITVALDELDRETLLVDWEWLVAPELDPIVLTAMGDLFLESADGSIHWLDTTLGELTRVADSIEQFAELVNEPARADAWLLPSIVVGLKQSGMNLDVDEVFSLRHPIILGGDYSIGNIEPTHAGIHLAIHGQIHRQVKDLPAGTRLSGVALD